jgi:hypothetical protein
LGYLNANELFPDMKGKFLEAYCEEVLDGKAYAVQVTVEGVYTKHWAELILHLLTVHLTLPVAVPTILAPWGWITEC